MHQKSTLEISHVEFSTLLHVGMLQRNEFTQPEFTEGKELSKVKISDLTRAMSTSKSATSKMLKNLEEKGYIIRIDDKKDKRIVYIELTSLGEETLEKERVKMSGLLNRVLEKVGKDNADQLLALLEKFYSTMEEEMKELN